MRKTKEIMLFGLTYQMTQLAAVAAYDRIVKDMDLLSLLSSIKVDGVTLDSEKIVNEKVSDKINVMQPRFVLMSLIQSVNEFNFGFMEKRKVARIPSYLRNDNPTPRHEDDSPIISTLISEGKASLRELEEYYSLEDAFKMYDIIFNAKLNDAESQYAISKRK